MPKFKVELSRVIRETKVVVVEAKSAAWLKQRLTEVYQQDTKSYSWEPDWVEDFSSGCQEDVEAHTILGTIEETDPHFGMYHEVKIS